MPETFPFPLDLSGYRDAAPQQIAALLEQAAGQADERAASVLTALLMNRVLRLLRQGSRQEILDEALMLNRFLAMDAGDEMRQLRPETFGVWTALGELLSGAARSTSQAGVPSLLRSTQGRGMKILELLAEKGGAASRAEVRRRLELGEAHLSHLLRDLEEADLIVRYRPTGSKEVLVELGPAGREFVTQSVLPPWLERLTSALSEIAAGSAFNSEALAQELQEAGAPSRLAADRLVAAVARLAPAAAHRGRPARSEPAGKSNVIQFVQAVENLREDGVSRYEEMRTFEASLPARALFGTPSAAP
jgi:DNA-binding MarR family transcriptional regulator